MFEFFNQKKDRIHLYYKKKRTIQFLKLYLKLYFLFIFIAYVVEINFYAVYQVRSSNMKPSLKEGSWVLVEKIKGKKLENAEEFKDKFKRGDIIIVNKAEEKNWFIKFLDLPVYLLSLGFFKLNKDRVVFGRVLALPNERIAIKDKTIYINDEMYIPSWFIHYEDFRILEKNILPRDNFSEVFVPADKVFLINDNWEMVNDSRILGLRELEKFSQGFLLGN